MALQTFPESIFNSVVITTLQSPCLWSSAPSHGLLFPLFLTPSHPDCLGNQKSFPPHLYGASSLFSFLLTPTPKLCRTTPSAQQKQAAVPLKSPLLSATQIINTKICFSFALFRFYDPLLSPKSLRDVAPKCILPSLSQRFKNFLLKSRFIYPKVKTSTQILPYFIIVCSSKAQ